MPSYKVISKGFYGGLLYDPNGKRVMLHTEEPFVSKDKKEQVPAWLEVVKGEKLEQSRARKSAETRAMNNAKKKAESDRKEITNASFLGAGESNTVETL